MERGQLAVLAVLIVVTATAWLVTMAHAQGLRTPAAGHAHHGHGVVVDEVAQVAALGMAGADWSLAGFIVFLGAWAVMMTAMMFPGLTPMLLLVHSIANTRRGREGASTPTAVFAAGYLLVWTAVGAATWGLVHAGGQLAARLGAAEQADWAPLLLGATMIVAGLYQFTPFKRLCLDHCRSPVVFVMQRWRDGRAGALRMGIGHGLYCFGCCWALFTVLVTAGIMSLAWMLALTLIDFGEKVLPAGHRAARAVGFALLLVGISTAMGFHPTAWLGQGG
jgi:predicted metal-binding membrane protein